MGSAVSVKTADEHACVDMKSSDSSDEVDDFFTGRSDTRDIVSVCVRPTADDEADSKGETAEQRGSKAAFLDCVKRKAEIFTKQSMFNNIDMEAVRAFLSDPNSLQLYKMFLKDKMDTEEGKQFFNVVCLVRLHCRRQFEIDCVFFCRIWKGSTLMMPRQSIISCGWSRFLY